MPGRPSTLRWGAFTAALGSHNRRQPQGPPTDEQTHNHGAEHPSTTRRHEPGGAHYGVDEDGNHGAECQDPRAARARVCGPVDTKVHPRDREHAGGWQGRG